MTWLVAVVSSYFCCQVLHHCRLFRFSKIFLENSILAFLSVKLLKMLRAALASCLRVSSAFKSPVASLFKWVPASFTARLSAAGFFDCNCSLTVPEGAGADLEAAATWVQVFGTLEPRNVPTEIQLDSPDMSQGSIGIPLGRLWTVEVAPRSTQVNTWVSVRFSCVFILFLFVMSVSFVVMFVSFVFHVPF